MSAHPIGTADQVLRDVTTKWGNAGHSQHLLGAYTDAVSDVFPQLGQTFVEPDLAGAVRSPAYWHLLSLLGVGVELGFFTDSAVAVRGEWERVSGILASARVELDALRALAERPVLRECREDDLERELADTPPGEAKQIRLDATLELGVATDDRDKDADLVVLRLTADLAGRPT